VYLRKSGLRLWTDMSVGNTFMTYGLGPVSDCCEHGNDGDGNELSELHIFASYCTVISTVRF
jgi:hypothetical protein